MQALVLSHYITEKSGKTKFNFSFVELKENQPFGKPSFCSQEAMPESKDVVPVGNCFTCDLKFGQVRQFTDFKSGAHYVFQSIDSISNVKVVKLG